MGSDWRAQLGKYIAPDCLPAYWGGMVVDEHGDSMCRSMWGVDSRRVTVPTTKIPPSLHWQAGVDGEPSFDQLCGVDVKAGTCRVGKQSPTDLWCIYRTFL
jgi:hypothetical protein